MIFLPKTRLPLSWFRCAAKTQRAQCGRFFRQGWTLTRYRNMSSRYLVTFLCISCLIYNQATARPVRKTLNFNMFVLQPHEGTPDRSILATDGVSRFGPILEYLVQRVQGLMSVRLPPEEASYHTDEKVPDVSENEVDGVQTKMPGVVVRPSRVKPGTYDVEIDVVVDDEQPNKID
ncbi:uncharacterized protein LOC123866589 [Maniola jurtina]|uniref:uncharacterized protein LOC123866589 n=1 Tax=Maniola jurtina TaxID=191418 RepID=UPI001E68B643|nr:uncharacterized protein LOC123866589 [Maniola jurtina]